MAKKAPIRKLKERTRNAGTMTESEFWGKIRSLLRGYSVIWKPIQVAKKRQRTTLKTINAKTLSKKSTFAYLCEKCNKITAEVEVDHKIEAGSLRCADDLPQFVERLFCEADGLQVLCKKCHQEKTNADRNERNSTND